MSKGHRHRHYLFYKDNCRFRPYRRYYRTGFWGFYGVPYQKDNLGCLKGFLTLILSLGVLITVIVLFVSLL